MKTPNSQAEVKPLKVGETAPSNVGGNPEPSRESSDSRACVESRRGVCRRCQGAIPAGKYSSAVYCSVTCRTNAATERYNVKIGKIKNPGVGSGGAQWGESNHMYKTGIGTFSKRAFAHYGRSCNRCQSTKFLVVHHRNHNRKNNELDNLEVLCKKCHQAHHAVKDTQGKYTKGYSVPLSN